jgi:mono/diheme cytochrome c family protein
MNTSRRSIAPNRVVPVLLGLALAVGLAWPRTTDSQPTAEKRISGPAQRWSKVSVLLPTSENQFPPGNGSQITAQCLICHSAGMVLRQPPLTLDEWVGEINKMRNAFGAPLPADQVDTLAKYLYTINGRHSPGDPTTVHGHGS